MEPREVEMASVAQSDEEASSREPVRAAAAVPGERPTLTRSGRRLIIMAGAVVGALALVVCVSSGVFSTRAPAPLPAPQISAAEALGKADEAYHRKD
jgi:hypothetical protein